MTGSSRKKSVWGCGGVDRHAQQQRPVALGSPLQRLTQAVGAARHIQRVGPAAGARDADQVHIARGRRLATGGQVHAVVEHDRRPDCAASGDRPSPELKNPSTASRRLRRPPPVGRAGRPSSPAARPSAIASGWPMASRQYRWFGLRPTTDSISRIVPPRVRTTGWSANAASIRRRAAGRSSIVFSQPPIRLTSTKTGRCVIWANV